MLSLHCLIVGSGNVVTVKISDQEEVNILKEEVKKKRGYEFPADELTLYMAKKEGKQNGEWIGSPSPEKKELSKSIVSKNIKDMYLKEEMEMDGTYQLHEYFKQDPPTVKSIHILVMVPAQNQSRNESVTETTMIETLRTFVTDALNLSDENLTAGKLIKTLPRHVFNINLGNGLYVREEYMSLIRMLQSKTAYRNLIIGSPGIGKSVFGIYLFILALRKHKDVAYHQKDDPVIYYFTWMNNQYKISSQPLPTIMYEAYFDGKEEVRALGYVLFNRIYLFASPRDSHFNEFKKERCFKTYMNPWTKRECTNFVNLVNLNDNYEWYQKFNLVGGKPRLLFSSNMDFEDLKFQLSTDIPSDFETVKKHFKHHLNNSFMDNMKHMLFSFYRNDGRPQNYYLNFSSLAVEAILEARFTIEQADTIRSMLLTPEPTLQSWRGKQLERMLLRDLVTRRFEIKALEEQIENIGSSKIYNILNVGSSILQSAEDIKDNTLKLYVALSKTFPAIDAILVVPNEELIIYVQVTVSNAHPIILQYLRNIYNVLRAKDCFKGFNHILLFLVSDDIYDNFKFQNYNTTKDDPLKKTQNVAIKQYVGRIVNEDERAPSKKQKLR